MASSKGNRKGKSTQREKSFTPAVKKDPAPSFVYEFSFVHPRCLENRLINSRLDTVASCIHIVEFSSEGTAIIKEDKVALPSRITGSRILGKPICIGCKNHFYVFQCAAPTNKYIQFFSVDTETNIVKVFVDMTKYFPRTIVRIAPIQCLISPDKAIVLLRLPQAVLRQNSYSNVPIALNFSNSDMAQSIDTCPVVRSNLSDRKLTCLCFYPSGQLLLVVHLDQLGLKCILQKYDISTMTSQTLICQENHHISVFISNTNESAISPMNPSLGLDQTAIDFNRIGDLVLFICFPTEKLCTALYAFDANTLKMSYSFKIKTNLKYDASILLSIEVSLCNSKLNIYGSQKSPLYRKTALASIDLPVAINLKSQVRTKILQSFTGNDLKHLFDSLPRQLQSYLTYNTDS